MDNFYRHFILENEQEEFKRWHNEHDAKSRIEKNSKISTANRLTYQEKCRLLNNRLKEMIQGLGLNINEQAIIEKTPHNKIKKIIDNRHEILRLYDDGVLDHKLAIEWLIKYGLIENACNVAENDTNLEYEDSRMNSSNRTEDDDKSDFALNNSVGKLYTLFPSEYWNNNEEITHQSLKEKGLTNEQIKDFFGKKLKHRKAWLEWKKENP